MASLCQLRVDAATTALPPTIFERVGYFGSVKGGH
jgi:hypothetical protein